MHPQGRSHPKSPVLCQLGIGDLDELEVMEATVETLMFQIAERKAELLVSKSLSADELDASAPPSTPEAAVASASVLVPPAVAVPPTASQPRELSAPGLSVSGGAATVSTVWSGLETEPVAAVGVASAPDAGTKAKARKVSKARDTSSVDVKTTRSAQLRDKARLAKLAHEVASPGVKSPRKPRRPPSGSSGSHPRTPLASKITAQKRKARARSAKTERLSSAPINHEDIDLELDAKARQADSLVKKREALQRTVIRMQREPASSIAANAAAEEDLEIDFAEYGIGLTAEQTAARHVAKVNAAAEFSHCDTDALATLPVASPARINASTVGFDLIKTWTDEFCGEIAKSAVETPPTPELQRVPSLGATEARRAAADERKFKAALMAGKLDRLRIDREKAAAALKRSAGRSKVKDAEAGAVHQAAVDRSHSLVSTALDAPTVLLPANGTHAPAMNSAVPSAVSQEDGSNASSTTQLPTKIPHAEPAPSASRLGMPAQQRPKLPLERTDTFADANRAAIEETANEAAASKATSAAVAAPEESEVVRLQRKMEEQKAAAAAAATARGEARARFDRLANAKAEQAAAAATVNADEDRLAEHKTAAASAAAAAFAAAAKPNADEALVKHQLAATSASVKADEEQLATDTVVLVAAAAKVKVDEDQLAKDRAGREAAKATAEQERRAKQSVDNADRLAKEREVAVAKAQAAAERIASEQAKEKAETDRIRRDDEAKRAAAAAKAAAAADAKAAAARSAARSAADMARKEAAATARAADAAARAEEVRLAEDNRAAATDAKMARIAKLKEASASKAKPDAVATAVPGVPMDVAVDEPLPPPPALAPSLTARFDKPKRATARLPSKRGSPSTARKEIAAPTRFKASLLSATLAITADIDSDNAVAGDSTDGQYEISSDDSASDESSDGDSKYGDVSTASDSDSDSDPDTVEDDVGSASAINATQDWPCSSPGMVATQEWPGPAAHGILDGRASGDARGRAVASAKDVAGEAQVKLAQMKSNREAMAAQAAQADADHAIAEVKAVEDAVAAAAKAESHRVAAEETANKAAQAKVAADHITREKDEAAKAQARIERAAREHDLAAKRKHEANQLRERQREVADERARLRAQEEKEAYEEELRIQEQVRAANTEATAKQVADATRRADEAAERKLEAVAEQKRLKEKSDREEERRLQDEALAVENHLRETAKAEAKQKSQMIADEEATKHNELHAAKEAAAARKAKIEADKAAKANRFNKGKGWSPTKPESFDQTKLELKPEPAKRWMPAAAAAVGSSSNSGGAGSDSSIDSSSDDEDGATPQPDTDSDGDSF